ncbi:MAG: AAA family ATPase, partial [Gammaproteobacteria bacterium]|nr:AAA family ATPase [Gammaproteobacteria bacterium]
MKFTAFRIKNYKGINDLTITLNGNKGSIYTLVGLNESGKTTILEAINSFRPDVDGIHVMAQKFISPDLHPLGTLVPKKKIGNFNDYISVTAHIKMEEEEVLTLTRYCKSEYGFQIDPDSFPLEFEVTKRHAFKNSAHAESQTLWGVHPLVKRKRGRKFVSLSGDDEEWQTIVREVGDCLPRIVYFPTFLFDFPEKIQVSEGECQIEGNEYFRQVVEDALNSLEDSLDLETHIVSRIINKNPDLSIADWHTAWMQSDERDQVDAVLTQLSRRISQEIFSRWNDISDTDLGKKELEIQPLLEAGDRGERQVFLMFKVKDNDLSFKVSERSLGFRWFFCFLLFTRFFRGNEQGESIFLFDEPASNLHSKAQSKLLDSLETISAGKNDIIYSTHSHYLINPLWLETASVVTNGSLTDGESIDADFGVENTDIHAQPYRTFVGQNADKGHYFQPVLDRLQVSPSLLETTREGVF